MTRNSFATGHGDSLDDLLKELQWQINELQQPNRFAAFSSKERYFLNLGLQKALEAVLSDARPESLADDLDEYQNTIDELTLLRTMISDVRDKQFNDEWNAPQP